jgi:hypothetical protein
MQNIVTITVIITTAARFYGWLQWERPGDAPGFSLPIFFGLAGLGADEAWRLA